MSDDRTELDARLSDVNAIVQGKKRSEFSRLPWQDDVIGLAGAALVILGLGVSTLMDMRDRLDQVALGDLHPILRVHNQ